MNAARFTHALLRITAGLFFLMHGGQKLLGWFGGIPGAGHVELASMPGVAGVLELVGGSLILLGFLTRPVAFLLAGEMAVAYFMMHLPKGLWPLQNMGEPAVLYCFVFLFLAGNGAGPLSVDESLRHRRHFAEPHGHLPHPHPA